ncbi:MAG: XRE family transcriptional regulator [Lachnospiraceae bacterium]|nr:XRE family transcriptional regulator [Lachnospiraceae bacterium]
MKRVFNGKRLKNARLFRGLTLTELASRTEISKQSLSLYENEKNIPEHERVRLIAEILNFPYEFFFQVDEHETITEVTYFRSLASATKMDRTAQSIKLEYVAKIYEVLLDYVDFPEINIPEVSFDCSDNEFDYNASKDTQEQIEMIANQVREHWKLEDKPIKNLQFLLEENGIIVTGFNTLEDKIDAFSQRTIIGDNDVFFIAVALGSRPEGRINFDMAHELGHILLHPWSENLELITKEDFKTREKQANMFASAFLLSKNSFSRDVSAYPTDLKYYQFLKSKWHVSMQAMIYRSNQLGLITENQFQYMMRQISKNKWRIKEPGDFPHRLNENIFQGAIDLLFEEKIFNPSGIINILKQHGVTLYRQDIENLLHLREDALFMEDKKVKIINIKSFDNQ